MTASPQPGRRRWRRAGIVATVALAILAFPITIALLVAAMRAERR